MATTTNNKTGIKLTITPKNEKEQKRIEAYLKRNEVSYTVRGNGAGTIEKPADEIEAELAYKKLTGNDRFRCYDSEKLAIKEGKTTRAKVIRQRIKDIEAGNIELVPPASAE